MLGKVQKKIKKFKLSDNKDVIKNEIVESENVISYHNSKKSKKKGKKSSSVLVENSKELPKVKVEFCGNALQKTRFSANDNIVQNELSVNKRGVEVNNTVNIPSKGKKRPKSNDGFHSDSAVGVSNKEVSPPCDDELLTDGESDLSDDGSANSVSSFNIDSYTSDDSQKEEEKTNLCGIPFNVVPSAEVEERESRTIFVGNLPKTIERHELQKWFSRFGKVQCVRLRSAPIADLEMPKKVAVIKKSFHENRSNIHAYIRYRDIESAMNALQANGTRYGDHTLRVDQAKHVGGYDANKAVFIGNVPFSVEEDSLISLFLKCGEIDSVRIVRDKDTGVGKGFAYINFKCSSSVPLALKLDGEVLEKRQLRVKPVKYNQKRKNFKMSSPFQNKINRSVYKERKLSSKNGHDTEKTGERRKQGPFGKPRLQENKLKREVGKHKGKEQFGKSVIKESQFQGEFSKRKLKTFKRKSFVAKKRELFSKILTNKKK